MKGKLFLGSLFALLLTTWAHAQMRLELSSSSSSTSVLGPDVVPVVATMVKDTSVSGFAGAFSPFSSPATTVTASWTAQSYPSGLANNTATGTGLIFGGAIGTGGQPGAAQVFDKLNAPFPVINNLFTTASNATPGTSISASQNYAFRCMTLVQQLTPAGIATSGRTYMGQLTLTFNHPVNNPVLHISGLGESITDGTNTLGIATELELATPGLSLSKLSGLTSLSVSTAATANTPAGAWKIINTSANPTSVSGGAASGSVLVSGYNITSIKLDVYVRGNGGMTIWGPQGAAALTSSVAGDMWCIGVSMNPPFISGKVLQDTNGLTDNQVNGTGTNAGGTLYANLVNATGTATANGTVGNVFASVPVATDGSFYVQDIAPAYPANFDVRISNVQGTSGQLPPANSLPAGWVHTGNMLGTGTGGSNTTPGTLAGISLAGYTATANNVNFGIERVPVAVSDTLPVAGNPALTYNVNISGSFTAADSDGTVAAININSFPSNVTSLRVGTTTYYSSAANIPATCPTGNCAVFPSTGGVNITIGPGGALTDSVYIDPAVGTVTPVITFSATDNAGITGSAANLYVPVQEIVMHVRVFGDFVNANLVKELGELYCSGGYNGHYTEGICQRTADATPIYVILSNAQGVVLENLQLDQSGFAHFYNVPAYTSGLKVQLNNSPGIVGMPAPPPTDTGSGVYQPSIGEPTAVGNYAAQDSVLGLVNVTTGGIDIQDLLFATDVRPQSWNIHATIAAAGTNQLIPINGGTNLPKFLGKSFWDGKYVGAVGVSPGPYQSIPQNPSGVNIMGLPANGELWYNGTKITYGVDGINPPSRYNPFFLLYPDLLSVKFTGQGYQTLSFDYAYVAHNGKPDLTPATYTVSLLTALPVMLTSFTASTSNCTATLNWETEEETGILNYAVEQSHDGIQYNTVASVPATHKNLYRIQVPQENGNFYYRLRINETDGRYAYSPVAATVGDCQNTAAVQVWPNPANEVLNISNMEPGSSIHIYNSNGQLVQSVENTKGAAQQISLLQLIPGMYYVSVVMPSGVSWQTKFMKQ